MDYIANMHNACEGILLGPLGTILKKRGEKRKKEIKAAHKPLNTAITTVYRAAFHDKWTVDSIKDSMTRTYTADLFQSPGDAICGCLILFAVESPADIKDTMRLTIRKMKSLNSSQMFIYKIKVKGVYNFQTIGKINTVTTDAANIESVEIVAKYPDISTAVSKTNAPYKFEVMGDTDDMKSRAAALKSARKIAKEVIDSIPETRGWLSCGGFDKEYDSEFIDGEDSSAYVCQFDMYEDIRDKTSECDPKLEEERWKIVDRVEKEISERFKKLPVATGGKFTIDTDADKWEGHIYINYND